MSTTTVTPTASDLFRTIEEISPMLRKFAAHHTSTHYAPALEEMAPEAQDLYQTAVAEILTNCKPGDTRSYMLNLGDWRMRNAANSARTYAVFIASDSDSVNSHNDKDENNDNDGIKILETIGDDSDNPETRLIEMEISSQVQDICRALKPEQATIIRLLREDCDIKEIARKLEVTHQAVRYHLGQIKNVFISQGLTPALTLT